MGKIKLDKIYKIAIIVLAIILLTHIILYANGRKKTQECIDKLLASSPPSAAALSIMIEVCEKKYKW